MNCIVSPWLRVSTARRFNASEAVEKAKREEQRRIRQEKQGAREAKPKRPRGQTDWFKENILGNPVGPQRAAIAPSAVNYTERQTPIIPVNLPDRSAPQPVLTPQRQVDKDFYDVLAASQDPLLHSMPRDTQPLPPSDPNQRQMESAIAKKALKAGYTQQGK